MTVLVYQDYVHNNGILFQRLCRHFGAENVTFCDADGILQGALDKAKLFVMPGGADLYYCEKLEGAANQAIRTFVEKGGVYLGICAGAYYGCAHIEWAKNDAGSICGPRELAFFKGKATGPIYEFIEDGDIDKSWHAAAMIEWDKIISPVFYAGGPVFDVVENDNGCTVLARYSALPGQPAAIIECTVDKGKAILCSPHLEYDSHAVGKTLYKHRNNAYERGLGISETLKLYDQTIEKIRVSLLERAYGQKEEKQTDQAA